MGLFDRARERAAAKNTLAQELEAAAADAARKQEAVRQAALARAQREREAAAAEAARKQEAAAEAVRKRQAAAAEAARDLAEYERVFERSYLPRRERLDWESATGMSSHGDKWRKGDSSYAVGKRIKYLEVPEPEPRLEDFLIKAYTPEYKLNALAEMRRLFRIDQLAYPEREKSRLKELESARTLYAQLGERELAERLQAQRELWVPHGVTLEPDVASTDGIEEQVRVQNAKIDRRVQHFSNLLRDATENTLTIVSTSQHREQRTDAGDVVLGIESALTNMRLGIDFAGRARAAYSPESRQVVIEYELPDVSIVPKVKHYRYVKSRNEITETARPLTQIKSLYAGAIAQLTLSCLATIFASDKQEAIDVAVFNGVVATLDPRSGQPVRPCLITLRVTRDTFVGINLAHVDPQSCLKHLSAGISKSPTELTPVRPVLEFSMVDPRFVSSSDAISTLDARPNLLELSPTEFEVLIQNLFTSMGLEARQTRPSRDGGVDCVAYNTRPILGGKIVIQAKRYKNTVGVSAVRDLYGTLQNEGASKGILVTTSGYGAASFEFARNKPIELIEGANLLYLLETHAGVTARIEPPEDWSDPESDAGETY